jgi:ABC-type Zn uptake system ZnuABC Zn-binding protein ZnuA
MGDVHPQGNPHYWLDPANGRVIAHAVAKRLGELSPGDATFFQARQQAFDARLEAAEKRWDALMAPHKGVRAVTYHRSWSNFVDRFGIQVVGYVEPRPGIPPSPRHTLDLIQEMKAKGVKLLIVEPYFDLKTPNSIARETGAQVVVLPPSVGGDTGIGDYVALFDHALKVLVEAIQATGAR